MPLRVLTLACALALLAGAPNRGRADDEAVAQARTSAKEWLVMLDAQDYDGAWSAAGALLKAAVTQDEWARRMSVTLGPLGKVESRAVRSSEYSTTLPGAPDGEYVVIQFDTSFESRQTALEEVVMRKQPDESWRVAGYRIR
ncbi:MAG: DUF4019 domain-containing protein [Acidobacteria bacterium]|nr:DUF4019 domain-containing protein [Acidobacteriota bacterium]